MARSSLGRRFSLASAGLGAAALLIASLVSLWVIREEEREAIHELVAKEAGFHARIVANDLSVLDERLAEAARSTILATGLVDSAGRETYLVPFLAGLRQIHGIPTEVLFTDFEGMEIANNGAATFSGEQLEWLRARLASGRKAAMIFGSGASGELVGLEPLTYARTLSPEGALFYKIALKDLHLAPSIALEWGDEAGGAQPNVAQADVPAPEVFRPLRLRVQGPVAEPPALGPASGAIAAIVIAGIILFAAVVLTGRSIAQLLTRDLRELERFSRKFLVDGPGTERARLDGSAEVISLALSINQMLDRLQHQRAELVEEGRKLSELAEALKQSDARKDEFLATLAHELRNPLAPIRNCLHLLRTGEMSPRISGMMERQVTHLVRLVDDLLEISRISRGLIELRKERVDIASVVESAREASEPLVASAGHHLSVLLSAEEMWVQGDPVRLAQVLGNLLNNAAIYTPPGGRIEIGARREGDEIVLFVRDNGSGISPEDLPRIFQTFTRGSGATGSGLGIGLALSRHLVELHGGSIAAKSEGAGQGSEFVVRLPAADGKANVEPQPSLPRAEAGRRVLIVDDNRDAADSLRMLMDGLGADVRVAFSGADALVQVREFKPALVLLDIGMPGMDGYEVARRIRSQPAGKGPRIVALTGWGQEADRHRSREAGFDDHLVKPAELHLLEDALARAADDTEALAGGGYLAAKSS